jgi:hypothetical protein
MADSGKLADNPGDGKPLLAQDPHAMGRVRGKILEESIG